MSDTPRTDSLTFWGRDMGDDSGPPHFECVDAEHVRDLERQLNKEKAKTRELLDILQKLIDLGIELPLSD